MADLFLVDKLTKQYADAHTELQTTVRDLNETIEKLKRTQLKDIKKAFANVAEKRDKLHAAISDSQDLFVKPKSIVLHGIKVGYAKSKGGIEIVNEEQTLKLIKKHFPELADALIKTKEKPIKKALNNLAAADLKKIGITVEETGDKIIISPVDSDVDKLIEALYKGIESENDE